MKKSMNKKVISIVSILIIIVVIAGMAYIKNKPSRLDKTQVNAPITATVSKAAFASVVKVTLTDEGKKQYKGAVKYQIYYEGKPVTQIMEIGKPTTAYPARKESEKVEIKILKADGKELYSVGTILQKGEKIK